MAVTLDKLHWTGLNLTELALRLDIESFAFVPSCSIIHKVLNKLMKSCFIFSFLIFVYCLLIRENKVNDL